MILKIAEKAGFCMGVDLALKKLDKTLREKKEKKVVTLGPIIHNPQVLKEYREKGVSIIENSEEVSENMHVVIRAHGITKDEEEKIRQKKADIIDATCPKVKAAQIAIEKSTKQAQKESILLLYGEEEHPEVRGLVSYSAIPYIVFANPEEIYTQIQTLPQEIILASQTTQDKEIYMDFIKKIKELPEVNLQVLHTICDATKERQDAVRTLAKEVDAFIVVGGKTSGNTRRLAEIASSYNLATYHIESAEELNIDTLDKNLRYGLTAGASTPKKYIDEVCEIFREIYNKWNYSE